MATTSIELPYDMLLKCRLNTSVFRIDGRDIREIAEILTYYHAGGWDCLTEHLPGDQVQSWWKRVRSYVEEFCWNKYLKDQPVVKPYLGTLEFQTGNHRAMALAILAGLEVIPVTLKID
jgi:hypothetical protein